MRFSRPGKPPELNYRNYYDLIDKEIPLFYRTVPINKFVYDRFPVELYMDRMKHMSSLDEQNESALACRARDGNREALARLLEANWAWLKGLIYNIVARPDAVDDVLQTVCVLCLDKISTLQQPERFKPWLATVARNAALAYRRQQSKQPHRLDDVIAAQQEDNETHNIADRLIQKEAVEQLLHGLKNLPEKYREVFILKHVKEMSYADIAESLDIPITTVQIRLVRARRMIYNHMTGRPNNKVPRT